jgi:hypothetical protein
MTLRPTAPTSPLVPELAPSEALVIGALLELAQQPPFEDLVEPHKTLGIPVRYQYGSPDARLVLEPGRAATAGITGRLLKLLHTLASSPQWQRRIRRCPYAGAGGRVWCRQFFLDTSPAGESQRGKAAVACSPAHAVRLNEAGKRRL